MGTWRCADALVNAPEKSQISIGDARADKTRGVYYSDRKSRCVTQLARHISAKYRARCFAPIFLDHAIGGKMQTFKQVCGLSRRQRRAQGKRERSRPTLIQHLHTIPRRKYFSLALARVYTRTHDIRRRHVRARNEVTVIQQNTLASRGESARFYFPRNYSRGYSTILLLFSLSRLVPYLFFLFLVISLPLCFSMHVRVRAREIATSASRQRRESAV